MGDGGFIDALPGPPAAGMDRYCSKAINIEKSDRDVDGYRSEHTLQQLTTRADRYAFSEPADWLLLITESEVSGPQNRSACHFTQNIRHTIMRLTSVRPPLSGKNRQRDEN